MVGQHKALHPAIRIFIHSFGEPAGARPSVVLAANVLKVKFLTNKINLISCKERLKSFRMQNAIQLSKFCGCAKIKYSVMIFELFILWLPLKSSNDANIKLKSILESFNLITL